MPVYRYFNPPNTATAHSESVTNHPNRLRIASLNLFSKNRRYNQVADWIRRTNPDIVVLIEAMPRWQRELKKRLPQYPVHKLIRRPSVSGKLILSKIPLEQIQLLPAGRTRSPTPLVTATYGQSSFRFAAIHASWPMTWTGARDRNQELKDLARVATAQPTPMIAVGDFNVTPFSEHYIALRKRSGLRRASAGRGWLPTWPTFFLPVGIQIDHILVSPQIQVLGYWSGSVADSDHCWVMADLLLPASPAPASGTD